MQVIHALTDQCVAKFGAQRCGKQLLATVTDGGGEGLIQLLGDLGAAAGGEFLGAGP